MQPEAFQFCCVVSQSSITVVSRLMRDFPTFRHDSDVKLRYMLDVSSRFGSSALQCVEFCYVPTVHGARGPEESLSRQKDSASRLQLNHLSAITDLPAESRQLRG